jgi:hypothetical protein
MTSRVKRSALWALLLVLTIAGLDATYWLLFFLWRSAAEPINNTLWRPRIYGWLSADLVCLAIFIIVATYLVKSRRNRLS